MALQRKIDWGSAMRGIRNDRAAPAAPGVLAACSLEIARLDRLAKEAAAVPFAVAGSYDCSSIMNAAIACAREQKAKGSKATWSQLVDFDLKNIWRHAKAQRAFAMN